MDLPFDPVTAITRGMFSKLFHSGVAKDWKNKPMSLSTGTPALRAALTIGFGVGYKCGIPGLTIRRATSAKVPGIFRSTHSKPSPCAISRAASLSSQQIAAAPPSRKARAADRPERPKPRTATFLPERPWTGIMFYPNGG